MSIIAKAAFAEAQKAREARYAAAILGRQLDDLGDFYGWSASGSGAVEADASDLRFGPAMKITAPQGSSTNVTKDLAFDARGKFISFKLKVLDGNFNRIAIVLGLNAANTNQRLEGTVVSSAGVIEQGRWRTVSVSLSARSLSGSPTPTFADLANVRLLRFECHATSGGNAEFLIADIRLHDDPIGPSIIWHFDDGRADTYTRAFPVLKAAGFRGQVAVETGNVGNAGRCSLEQLQEMYAAGWAMLNHTTTGGQLDSGNLTDLRTRVSNALTYLRSNGLYRGSDHFVYPGTTWDATIMREVRKYALTARMGGTSHATPLIGELGILPAYYFSNPSVTLSTAKQQIDRIKSHGSGILYFTFHSLVDEYDDTEDWLYDDFVELVAYAREQGIPARLAPEVWPTRPPGST